jgi:hypothetical protein
MSELNYQELGKSLLPVFNSLVNSLFEGDFDMFLKHHPPTPEDSFNEAVAILKPLGKPIKLEYLCHLAKLDRVKMLCKVTYGDTIEELVWDFNFKTEGDEFKLINIGFDK